MDHRPRAATGGRQPAGATRGVRLTRRTALAAVGGLGVASLAGCFGLFEEDLVFEATPASVPEEVLSETGYEFQAEEEIPVERTYEVGDETQTVQVINWSTEYDKRVDVGGTGQRAAVFSVLSSPRVEVLGRSFNPVGDMSTVELADMIQERYEEFDDLEHVDDGTIEVLGEETTRSRFRGDVQLDVGATVEVDLHVTEAVESGEDFVVCVGGHPTLLPDEEGDVLTMMRGVVHGA